MIIKRQMEEKLLTLSKEYPITLVQGPRQSGKTTLVKEVFKDKPYFLVEDEFLKERIESDPKTFFSSLKNGAIFDEVQAYPKLLTYIKAVSDEHHINGEFVLTGSNNLLLMQNVSESLAGRVAIFKLLPLSLKEISTEHTYGKSYHTTNKQILEGGYPRLIAENLSRDFFFENYTSTYLERDVRNLAFVNNLSLFHKFLRILATRVGSLLEITSLSSDVGVSTKTINSWLSILEASYICFRLYPYYDNIGKRLIKTPKLYFYDTGLLSHLLSINSDEGLMREKLRGALFENLIILEFIKNTYNSALPTSYYFYRTSKGVEVDLIAETNGKLSAYEIKSATTFTTEFIKNLISFQEDFKYKCTSTSVIYTGLEDFRVNNINVENYRNLYKGSYPL